MVDEDISRRTIGKRIDAGNQICAVGYAQEGGIRCDLVPIPVEVAQGCGQGNFKRFRQPLYIGSNKRRGNQLVPGLGQQFRLLEKVFMDILSSSVLSRNQLPGIIVADILAESSNVATGITMICPFNEFISHM